MSHGIWNAVAAPPTVTGSRRRERSGAAVRRPWLVLAATVLALVGTLGPASAPPVQAAADGLNLTTSTTYTLVPASHAVRVVVNITARNNKPNQVAGGIVTRYFYETFRLAVQPEARSVKATTAGAALAVANKAADGYAIVEVHFASSLFFHQTEAVRLSFDLPGGAPRSASEVRVGTAFATFNAWAFGDTGSVRIIVPTAFDAETTGSVVTRTSSGGATVFNASAITDVGDWYVVVNADRKSALTNTRIDLTGGEHVVIRAWPEDKEWQRRVRGLLTDGLPELVQLTGLSWPVPADLSVFEVHTPLLEGYAGVFFEGQDKIEISEDLDDLTILHESSHAWFNGQLFAGRWINEGFADTYAAKALDGIGLGGWTPNPVKPTAKAAVRLNDWTHPGRIADQTTDAREQYGYDASWTVVSSIVREVGDGPMRDVLAAAQNHTIPYVGAGTPETVTGPADWRRLLDLLDELGRSKTADDVFRRWVVTDEQAHELDDRAAARAAYAALAALEGDWPPPPVVRSAMADWDFATATARINDATTVLGRRDELATLAASLGIAAPTKLEAAYESSTESFDAANQLLDAELQAGRVLQDATARVAAPRDLLVSAGLLGTAPEADLAAADAAFSAGSADTTQATAVSTLVAGASGQGRARLIAAGLGLVVMVVLLIAGVLIVRRNRRARGTLAASRAASRAAAQAAAAAMQGADDGWLGTTVRSSVLRLADETTDADATADSDPAAGVPYATLADQSAGPANGPPATAEIDPSTVTDPPPDPPIEPADRGDAS